MAVFGPSLPQDLHGGGQEQPGHDPGYQQVRPGGFTAPDAAALFKGLSLSLMALWVVRLHDLPHADPRPAQRGADGWHRPAGAGCQLGLGAAADALQGRRRQRAFGLALLAQRRNRQRDRDDCGAGLARWRTLAPITTRLSPQVTVSSRKSSASALRACEPATWPATTSVRNITPLIAMTVQRKRL